MTSSLRIGRIAGVDIGVNWSWLIVFGLITWSLAAGVFPSQNPGLGDGTYVTMAVVAAVAFFASLLLHELGHAVEARRQGMAIAGITLWLFGGVARFEGEFPSARAELRIAVAGPLVSLVIGVLLAAAAAVLPLPVAVDGVVAWLGYINLALLVFNLLPALPLDGGRMLRAALWARRRSFLEATRTAAGIARGLGIVLIVGGLFALIFAGAFGGAWLAFIGWFLLAAAEAELQAATTRGLLGDLKVRDLMVEDPVTARPDMTLRQFIDEVFAPHRHTAYPVIGDDGRAVGLINFRAVAPLPADEWPQHTVAEHMEPIGEVAVAGADDPLGEAFTTLARTPVNRALVCADDRLLGLLSITDLARIVELRSIEGWEDRQRPGRPPDRRAPRSPLASIPAGPGLGVRR